MATQKQISANRKNAKRSTGPRTRKGKIAASRNALKHGLLSQDALIPGEDAAEFELFCNELKDQIDPSGGLPAFVVDGIAMSAWRKRRVHRIEASMFAYRMAEGRERRASVEARSFTDDALTDLMLEPEPRDVEGYDACFERARAADTERDAEELGEAFIKGSDTSNAFSKLSRYETTIERGLMRAMHVLERLQAARAGQTVHPPAVVEIDVRSDQSD